MPTSKGNINSNDITKASETELDLFFKYSFDIMVLIGFDNRIKQVSPSFEIILGWKKEEVISKCFQDFLHPDDIERSNAEAKAHETGKNADRFENRYRCKDGSYKWISWNSHPISEKQIVVGIGRDITDSKKSENALRLSEERFSKAFNLSPFAVIMTRLSDGKYVDVNDTFLKMLGYTRNEVIGYTANEIKIYANPNGRAQYLAAFKNGRVLDFEVDLKTKTGKPIKALGYAEIINVNGQDLTIGTLVDITESKKAEEALAYRANLLSNVRDAIFGVDSKYNITYWNKSAEDLLGYSQEEVLGKNFQKLIPIKIESSTRKEEVVKLEAMGHWEGEVQYRRKDGSYVFVELTTSTLKSPNGDLQGVITTARDITERKKAEEEIKRLASFPTLNSNPIVEADFDGKIFYANPAAKNIFPDIEALGSTHDLLSDWQNVVKTFERQPTIDLNREVKIGEQWFTQQLSLVPNHLRIRICSLVITERKKAEEALAKSEQRWATTLSSIGDAVIATDTLGNIVFMNHEAESLTGWKLGEASQKPTKTVFNIINERTRLEVESPIERVLKEGIVVGLANHTVLVQKDGKEIPIDDSGAPIKDRAGKITGVVLVFEMSPSEGKLSKTAKGSQRSLNPPTMLSSEKLLTELLPLGIKPQRSCMDTQQMR